MPMPKKPTTYEFRAQCLKIIDGDTVDLYVDLGFHEYRVDRFRIHGIDTAELNSKDTVTKQKAVEAKNKVEEWLKPQMITQSWPLRIVTYKDPDSFGRWLAEIFFKDPEGTEQSVGQLLMDLKLAVEYKR